MLLSLFSILSLITACSMFFDYKKDLRLIFKIILIVLILLTNIGLWFQEKTKEKTAQDKWNAEQWAEDIRNRELAEAYRKGPEEKKKSPIDDSYRETAQGFFDANYSRLKDLFGTNKKINEHYLTIYFSEVSKIPNFYNWEEWRETEGLLFDSMRTSLQGYFINRGRSEYGKTMVAEFSKERQKYLKAKEREYKK